MLRHKLQILNKFGVHARPAAKLVKAASQFTSCIEIQYHDKKANAKDMLAVMMLGLAQDSWIELIISGPDLLENQRALSTLQLLIQNFFDEEACQKELLF